MKKRILSVLLGVAMVSSLLVGCGGSSSSSDDAAAEGSEASGDGYKIIVVPKMTNLAWFERMEYGVEEVKDMYAEQGISVEYGGSAEGDGQAEYVEGLIGQGYDAICVVPFDVEALDPILKKAQDEGITVICHEASTVQNMDYDIEAFDTKEYGAHLMAKLEELTGGEGQYIQTVGALTSISHVEEADGGKEYADANCPGLVMATDKIISDDNADTAYSKVKEALTANPDINAIQCAAMSETPGAARAVEELGLAGKVHIAGTSLVSVCGEYVESGVVELMSFWDPALAGQAMIELAIATLDGTVTEDGSLSLTTPGYETLTFADKVFTGAAWIDVDASNVNDEAYDF